MARQRSHSIEFKRQVAQEFVAGRPFTGLPSGMISRANRSGSGLKSMKLVPWMKTPRLPIC